MGIRYWLQAGAVALFGGERCLRCGKPSGSLPLCSSCRPLLEDYLPLFAPDLRCRVCGKPLLSEIGLCMQCRSRPVLTCTDGVYPLHVYRLWTKSLLHAWKAEGRRTLSPLFAGLLARSLHELSEHFAAGSPLPLVPVPPRPGKIRRSGWDQISELCALLKKDHGQTVLPLLRRLSSGEQKKRGRRERLAAAKSAYVYAPSRSALRRIKKEGLPAAVVLLDDVLTTGATLEACAQALKAAGVRTVYAVTLFIVD